MLAAGAAASQSPPRARRRPPPLPPMRRPPPPVPVRGTKGPEGVWPWWSWAPERRQAPPEWVTSGERVWVEFCPNIVVPPGDVAAALGLRMRSVEEYQEVTRLLARPYPDWCYRNLDGVVRGMTLRHVTPPWDQWCEQRRHTLSGTYLDVEGGPANVLWRRQQPLRVCFAADVKAEVKPEGAARRRRRVRSDEEIPVPRPMPPPDASELTVPAGTPAVQIQHCFGPTARGPAAEVYSLGARRVVRLLTDLWIGAEGAHVIDIAGNTAFLRKGAIICPARCPAELRDLPADKWWPRVWAVRDLFPWLAPHLGHIEGSQADAGIAYLQVLGERPAPEHVLREGVPSDPGAECTSYVASGITLHRGYLRKVTGLGHDSRGTYLNQCAGKLLLPHTSPSTLYANRRTGKTFNQWETCTLFAGDELFDDSSHPGGPLSQWRELPWAATPSDDVERRLRHVPRHLHPRSGHDQFWAFPTGYEVHRGAPRVRYIAWARLDPMTECPPTRSLVRRFVAARDRWLDQRAPPVIQEWIRSREAESGVSPNPAVREAAWWWLFNMQPTSHHAGVCKHGRQPGWDCGDCGYA
eukprot:gene5628-7070_t